MVVICLYVIVLAIWRLYFSPLTKIPGPKLAALTQWYETYLEIFKREGGQFSLSIGSGTKNIVWTVYFACGQLPSYTVCHLATFF